MFWRTLSSRHLTALIEFCLLVSLVFLFSVKTDRAVLAQGPLNSTDQYLLSEASSTPTPTESITPTPTESITFTPTLTATQVVTPTSITPIPATTTPVPTETTVSPTLTSTETVEINNPFLAPTQNEWYAYLPGIYVYRIPTTTRLFCSQNLSISIPDDNPQGISNSLQIDQPGIVMDVNIYMNINHSWPGDLKVSLLHQASSIRVDLIDRPGVPASSLGCGLPRIQTILDDEASQPAENTCGAYPAGIAGIFQPSNPLNQFDRQSTTSLWTLEVSDLAQFDTGNLQKWCLEITSVDPSVAPTPPPVPVTLPSSASVSGVTGQTQTLALDCESRTAVDWAKFFGTSIPELEFYNRLPHSDNPEKGFVGNVNGTWGYVPPNDYGVHAAPVAALLRAYGVDARAYHSLRWDDIRAEIASGNPVMVWITGSTYAGRYPSGAPQYYISASDNNYTVVANYEHTVIVTGYTSSSVTIRDGSSVYNRNLDEFLDSWSSLRNMAILARP